MTGTQPAWPTSRPGTICFLVGAPRSGTTWVQRLLQSHPAICGGEESHFFTLFAAPLRQADEMQDRKDRRIGPLCYIDRPSYEACFSRLWDDIFHDLYAQSPRPQVHLEKTPFHTLVMEDILRLFPEAKFIFLLQDSRAVAASLVHAGRSWGKHWAPTNYRAAALDWLRHVNAVRRFRRARPYHPVLQVRYEDVVADAEGQLATMLRFLLPDDDDLRVAEARDAFEAQQSGATDPKGFSRKRGIDGWKRDMSPWAKLVTWHYTRKMMREFGYDISPFG